MSGEVVKLIICSYKDNTYRQEISDKRFTAPINPESFTRNYKVVQNEKQPHGTAKANPKYVASTPEELKLEFILDGTDTVQGYFVDQSLSKLQDDQTVHSQIDQFLNCTYTNNGDIHSPNFLKIIWGQDINFKCKLKELDINFTLFDTNGDPIRAKLTANFIQYIAPKEQQQLQRNESPDLTKYINTGSGDKLDLMAYNMYGDPKYVLQVAMINKLTSIRNLKPGLILKFPPFDKKNT